MREEIGETLREIVELMLLRELRQLRESLNEESIVFSNGASAEMNKADGEALKSRGISGIFPPPQLTTDTTPITVAEESSRRDKKRQRLSEGEKNDRKRAYARKWYAEHKGRISKKLRNTAGHSNPAATEAIRQKAAMREIATTRSADEV